MLTFSPGEEKTARVTVRNPTATVFDYVGRLYMDTQQKAEASFHLEADEQKDVLFPVTMPAEEGTYSVTLDVLVEGEVIAKYAAEDIQIVAPKPTFAITNLAVAPTEVHPGDQVEIVATIKNEGDVAGICTIGTGASVDFLVKTTPLVLLTYDNGQWLSFFFFDGYPGGELEEVIQGETYIVVVNADCVWEIEGHLISLVSGPNFIIYPGPTKSLPEALTNIGPDGLNVFNILWYQPAREISLEPGESKDVSFFASPTELGTYTAEVNGLTKQFVCVAPVFDPWAYDTNKDGVISKAETLVALQDYFSEFITKEQVTEVLQLYYDGVKAALVLRFFAVTTPAAGQGVFEIHCHIKNIEDYEVRAQFNLVGTRAGKEIDEIVDFTLKPGEIYDYVYRDSTYEGDYVQAKVVSEWGGTPTLEFEAGYFKYGVNLVATEIGADYVVLRYTRDETCDTWDFGLETEDQTINFPDLKIAGGWPTIYHLVTGLLPGRTYKAWCSGRNGGSMTGRTEFTT